jgi:hypothetical protein
VVLFALFRFLKSSSWKIWKANSFWQETSWMLPCSMVQACEILVKPPWNRALSARWCLKSGWCLSTSAYSHIAWRLAFTIRIISGISRMNSYDKSVVYLYQNFQDHSHKTEDMNRVCPVTDFHNIYIEAKEYNLVSFHQDVIGCRYALTVESA